MIYIYFLQKQAICLVNKAGYHDHTTPPSLNSHAMKLNDLVYCKIMEIMFRAKSRSLTDGVEKFFYIHFNRRASMI